MTIPILSGQVTVVTAGVPVQMPSIAVTGDPECKEFGVYAPSTNTGIVYLGNDGTNTVDSTTGFCLDPGMGIQLGTNVLDIYYLDADNSGDSICWIKDGKI